MPRSVCIEAALQLTTERFAAELSQPSGQAPAWSEFEWTMARAAAVIHGVTPLLANLPGWREPQHWHQFVTQQRHHTALRAERLAGALALIDEEARRAMLPVLALKGSALYALGLYPDAERPMADIDLLVAPENVKRVRGLLERLAFREVSKSLRHRVFVEASAPPGGQPPDPPYGERAGATLKVELHRHIAECFPGREVDITGWLWPRERHPGVNPYSSLPALMGHLLLHAAGNMANLGLRLIHLHDIALLARRMRAVDWDMLLEQRIAHRRPWWALPPLELVARYYPDHIPGAVLAALRPLCPRRLRKQALRRRISDFSYSTPTLQAFPALPWALSFTDQLAYMRSRVWPNAETLRLRAIGSRETWARGNPWRQQSQGRQILHWLLARPLRPASMFLVRAAMADQAARAGQSPPGLDAQTGIV
ncbi:MAG TPA: nucleotidyltransferase family protein [Steroidobacteraceae bacterium]